MTSVLRFRSVLQVCFLVTLGLIIAAVVGCAPPAADDSNQPSTAPATVTEPAAGAPVAEQPAEQPAAEKPLQEEPAVEEPAVYEPAVEEPVVAPPAVEKPGDQEAAEEFDPTYVVTVKWLPEPIENPDAEAKTEIDMKAYTEKIPDTEVAFEMVPIPGGKFIMGSPKDEEGRWLTDKKGKTLKDEDGNKVSDEGPQHEVEIEPFWMGKYEVTWDEYELYGLGMDKQRRDLKHKQDGTQPTDRQELVDAVTRPTKPYTDMTFGMGKEGYPAICMSQLAARAYCKWLSAKTGRYYRLPTEAEWEYACRAGTTTAYYFGDDPDKLDEYGWYFDNSEDKEGYHKVGQKKPNPWGLYDMHGNVSEWVLDQYFADYYQQFAGKTTRRPLAVPAERDPRVARGGCWDDDPEKLRSAARFPSHRDWRMQDPQIPNSIWYNTEVYCPGIRLVRPLAVPDEEEAKLYEPSGEVIKEYKEAQAGKE